MCSAAAGAMSPGTVEIHTDGAARGNPGPAGAGVVIRHPDGAMTEVCEYIDSATNNEAEYSALIIALESALEMGARRVKILSDSVLIVEQIKGFYKVKSESLRHYHSRANQLIGRFDSVEVEAVRREQNRQADRLANLAIDEFNDGKRGIKRVLLEEPDQGRLF